MKNTRYTLSMLRNETKNNIYLIHYFPYFIIDQNNKIKIQFSVRTPAFCALFII
jgi:hypothetical protein